MTIVQARLWVKMNIFSDSDNSYGKNSSWGIYTKNADDALMFAVSFGFDNIILETAIGCYPHYHINNHDFYGYKHFHVWFVKFTRR